MFIGNKEIKSQKPIGEKTAGGIEIIAVEFKGGSQETFSQLMFNKVISEEPCDDSVLRDKRLYPVVEIVLGILRDWGIKLNELAYFSAVLNNSLQFNEKEALKELWLKWIPTLKTIDDVDLIAVDRVLKSRPKIKNEKNN
mgnify:CR=1 FL=1